MVGYEVAPVLRTILSVDMLNSKGGQVVFGLKRTVRPMTLPEGHRIPKIRENGAMVLDATLLDEQDLRKRTLVAPMSQVEVQEVGAIPVFGGAREVNRSKQHPEQEIREKNTIALICLVFRGVPSVAEHARLMIHIQQQFVTRKLIHVQ